MSTITRKLRQRRNARTFDAVMRSASPAMQQELIAMAAQSQLRGR